MIEVNNFKGFKRKVIVVFYLKDGLDFSKSLENNIANQKIVLYGSLGKLYSLPNMEIRGNTKYFNVTSTFERRYTQKYREISEIFQNGFFVAIQMSHIGSTTIPNTSLRFYKMTF
jgi:hypothetical protein